MFHLIGIVIIGFFAGLIARWLKPGDDSMGWIMTAVLGIAGSFVANYGGQLLHLYAPGSKAGFIASVIGAIIILFVYSFFKRAASE